MGYLVIRRLDLLVMFLLKKKTTLFLPIWNKIQNLGMVSGSFRSWVVSVGSFRPESFRPFFVVLVLEGGSIRPDF